MFRKLRQKIIIITMAITTTVLLLAGFIIMLFSSTMRPEPKPFPEQANSESFAPNSAAYANESNMDEYIKTDREEGSKRLLFTLLSVGAIIEISVFIIILFFSEKIVAPVKSSFDKQKLFIANASHELKTPLAVIQANIEAMNVKKEDEKWKKNIESEIDHASNLVLNLLKLAKLDTKSISQVSPEEFDLNSEIQKHISLFEPKFTGNILFKSNSQKTFYLPKQDFLQVFDILLDNAVKYGQKKISISLNSNSLSVSNDGTTIPQELIPKIFDRFYQTDKTREGSGLGLAILKAICEQNGWNVSCNSSNHLTKFTVTFSRHK